MANVHPIVYALKKEKDKQARRVLLVTRLAISDVYLNKKSKKKILKLI